MYIIPEKIILGKRPAGNQGYLVFLKPDGSTKNEVRFKNGFAKNVEAKFLI